MSQLGRQAGAFGLEAHGFRNLKAAHWNLAPAALYEHAIARGEGRLAKDGPLVVLTGQHTGRSPGDKFIVKDAETEGRVWWDNNKAMTPESAEALLSRHARLCRRARTLRQGFFASADPRYCLPVRIVTEFAWHALFAHQLLIRPEAGSA